MKHYAVTFGELVIICKGISQDSTGDAVLQIGNEYEVRGMARTANLEALGNLFADTESASISISML